MNNKEKDIIYAIFLDCCKFTNDIFWKTIFEELSRGITPYGIYISKDFLCCNFKNKEFSYKIDIEKDSEILFNEIFDIFKNKFGLLSIQEKIEQRQIFDNIKDNLKKNKEIWSNIRKKNLKENIIEKFILKQKKIFNLSVKQCRYIIYIITTSLIFKIISNNDIIYKNSEIIQINGIIFQQEKIILDKDIFMKEIENLKPKIEYIENKVMLKNWYKLLKDINKNEIYIE
jgi:hypothetical protein